jgi:hypothetical protein
MKAFTFLMHAGAAALLLTAAGCERSGTHGGPGPGPSGVIPTKFPGQVSAGGGTSGQVLARSGLPKTDATYAGGTPGIAGGSGGTTSGAATGGTVQESGHGPSQGTTQPSSVGRPDAKLQPGDMGKPAGPAEGPAAGAAVHQDNPPPAAPSTH